MKSKANSKSAKKAPVSKKKSAAKKKPAPKSAKKSRPVSGKKSSELKHIPAIFMEELNVYGWNEIGPRTKRLLKKGFPPEDIQVVIRYRTAGGIVEDTGPVQLHDAWEERGMK